MDVAAILPAAGHGTRMGKDLSKDYGSDRKQFMKLCGVPILALTIRKFLAVPRVKEILVAVPDGSEADVQTMLEDTAEASRVRVLAGGRNRQESVRHCLDEVSDGIQLVAVHDGVRPFIPVALIEEALDAAAQRGAVILGMPAEETVKQISLKVVRATLPRERIMLVQTPQVFALDLLKRAFDQARQDGFVATDEASLVEHINEDVYVLRGSERNIKITRPHHLSIAQLYFDEERRESATIPRR